MGGFSHYYPEYFADQRIKFRIPYDMYGGLLVEPNQSGVQFPDATFLLNRDKPFEIHGVHVELTAFDDDDPPNLMETQSLTLDRRIFLRITDTSKNEILNQNRSLVASMIDSLTRRWEWDMPYTLVRSEGFAVAVDSLAFPAMCVPDPAAQTPCDPAAVDVGFVRVDVTFSGYLLVLHPPGETR